MDSSVQLKVGGMTCQGCVRSVTKKLSGVAGVSSAAVDLTAGTANVDYDDSRAKVEDLIDAVEQIGFNATPIT
jgi:copper chaperone